MSLEIPLWFFVVVCVVGSVRVVEEEEEEDGVGLECDDEEDVAVGGVIEVEAEAVLEDEEVELKK